MPLGDKSNLEIEAEQAIRQPTGPPCGWLEGLQFARTIHTAAKSDKVATATG
jgi:hypothetical protein